MLRFPQTGLLSLLLVLGLTTAAPAQTDATKHQAVVAIYPVMLQAVQARNLTQARTLCQQAISYEPNDPVHRYNMACIESLSGAPNAAFAALNQAIARGYNDPNSLQTDADFAPIRADARFAAVVQAAQRNASAGSAATAATVRPVGPRPTTPAATATRPATPATATRPAAPAARPATAAATGAAVAQPVAGKVTGNRPVGLFFMTRYWIATRSLEKSSYYFTPDGRVFVDPTGFSAAELAAFRGSHGTYQVGGNELTIKWSDGSTSKNTVEDANPNGFNWDAGIFAAVKPFSSPQQLVGTFEGGNSVSTGMGSIITSGTYTFRADGTYTRSGVASATSVSSESTVKTGGQGQTAGRWQLSGFLLTLTDAQGQVMRAVSFPFASAGQEAKPDRIYFSGTTYKRQ